MPQQFYCDMSDSKAVSLLQFLGLLVLFSLECFSVMPFRVFLTFFGALEEQCFAIVAFPGYPHV